MTLQNIWTDLVIRIDGGDLLDIAAGIWHNLSTLTAAHLRRSCSRRFDGSCFRDSIFQKESGNPRLYINGKRFAESYRNDRVNFSRSK